MDHSPFLPLLLITGLAAVVPVLASRFRAVQFPIVVGEILAGIVIGHSGLNLVESTPTLEFLAEFGFTYLMFLSGLEVDFTLLAGAGQDENKQPLWKRPIPVAVLVFGITLVLALIGAMFLRRLGLVHNPLLMGLILSTTSLGVVVPVLKERGMLGERYGQSLLVAALVADFATLVLLTVVIAMASRGLTLDLLLVLVLLVAFALAARAGRQFASVPILRQITQELSHATAQIQVRGAFALMVAWVVLAESLGVEIILGAFLAGAVVSLMAGPGESPLREKMDAIGFGFFIPIFFIMVGVSFDLRVLLSSTQALLLVPLLIGIAYVVKLVAALAYRLQFSWRETFAGGFLLSSRLSLIIAAAAIASEIGAISQAVNSAIILVAVVTCTISPMLFNRLIGPAVKKKRHGVIIAGTDQMAELLARRLQAIGEKVLVIGLDERRLRQLRQAGVPVIEGSPADDKVLEQAGAREAQALVALTSSVPVRLRVCEMARHRFGIPLVVAQVASPQLVSRLQAMGVKVVQPAMATVIALEGALRFPTAFDVLVDQGDEVEVGEAILRNKALAGRPLRRLRLPGNALILSIRRNSSVMVPHGDTVLRVGDRLALIGSPESVERARALLGE